MKVWNPSNQKLEKFGQVINRKRLKGNLKWPK